MKKVLVILSLCLLIGTLCGCSKEPKTIQEPDLMKIRNICNLATLECNYHNVAKATKTAGAGFEHWGEKDRKFWIEYTGTAKIGIDMEKVEISIQNETVTIKIPEAKIIDAYINKENLNADSYIVSGDGFFNKNKITAEDQTAAINDAQNTMIENINKNSQLLLSAQERAKELIKNYIDQMSELSGIEYQIEWTYIDKE